MEILTELYSETIGYAYSLYQTGNLLDLSIASITAVFTVDFWLQAFIFATGLGGQALIAKKKISGFYLWFAGNIAVIATTFPKGMYGMALLYFIYIGFNLYSIREWGKDESSKQDVDEGREASARA